MGAGYTELFFLDEPTALAAGHRPCFECRRAAADAFARAWSQAHGLGQSPRADAMDDVLHTQRRSAPVRSRLEDLADGVAVEMEADGRLCAAMIRGDALLRWTPDGYRRRLPRPENGEVRVLTPPAIVAVLAAGYAPIWHPSAD